MANKKRSLLLRTKLPQYDKKTIQQQFDKEAAAQNKRTVSISNMAIT
jgi:hypothetical protein